MISAFQFKYFVREKCTNEVCFARLRGQIPYSTDQLVECMRRQECQIMNRQLTTYVCLGEVCVFCESIDNAIHLFNQPINQSCIQCIFIA